MSHDWESVVMVGDGGWSATLCHFCKNCGVEGHEYVGRIPVGLLQPPKTAIIMPYVGGTAVPADVTCDEVRKLLAVQSVIGS